jgi:hypothetical protein
MLFGDEDSKEFQAIYQEDFGEAISESEARLMATRLITLYETLSRPLPHEEEPLAGFQDSGNINLTGDVEPGNEAKPVTPPERSFFNKTNSYQ